jgi:hypothetical protein
MFKPKIKGIRASLSNMASKEFKSHIAKGIRFAHADAGYEDPVILILNYLGSTE